MVSNHEETGSDFSNINGHLQPLLEARAPAQLLGTACQSSILARFLFSISSQKHLAKGKQLQGRSQDAVTYGAGSSGNAVGEVCCGDVGAQGA